MADRCYKHRAKVCLECQDHEHLFSEDSTYRGGNWYCYCGAILPPKRSGEVPA